MSYRDIIVSRLSSFLFTKCSLPHGCKFISSLLKNSLSVKLHLSHVTLPIILFSMISRETTSEIIRSIFCSNSLKIKSRFFAWSILLGYPSNIILSLNFKFKIVFFRSLLTISSETKLPFEIMDYISLQRSVFFFVSLLNKSPVDS